MALRWLHFATPLQGTPLPLPPFLAGPVGRAAVLLQGALVAGPVGDLCSWQACVTLPHVEVECG
eukprot:11307413-Alexandrium_andersonii.AAC.1